MENLNPVYIVLFSNYAEFSKLIRAATKSEYSHATISLDPSLNEMYSFTGIPYAKSLISPPASLIKESIYGPMYSYNLYFTVLITFVNDEGLKEIKKKIDFFVKNHDKYRYNQFGLIKYFFNIRKKGLPDEEKKKKWFCSEFVSYLLKVGGLPGIDTVMKSPQDLYNSDLYVESVDYTLKTFSEENLRQITKQAKAKFIRHEKEKEMAEEMYYNNYGCEFFEDIAMEVTLPFSRAREQRRTEWSLINYTTMIDWKYLHNEFIKTFGTSNLDYKFKMIEMIIRKGLNYIQTSQILDYIIMKFASIASYITGGSKITFIDVKNGIIEYIQSGKKKSLNYNELVN